MDPKYIYEVIYVAKDPKVIGLGFAAVRDAVEFFSTASADNAGTPNPIAGVIKHTIGASVSQSGNLIRTFVHLGFDERLRGGKLLRSGRRAGC